MYKKLNEKELDVVIDAFIKLNKIFREVNLNTLNGFPKNSSIVKNVYSLGQLLGAIQSELNYYKETNKLL